jgi:hypothetical protein
MCGKRHHHHHRAGGTAEPRRSRLKADDLRASDAEREGVVSDLRTHATDGRLSVDELGERVEAAYGARTRRELVAVVEDLPHPRRTRPRADARAELREHVRTYLLVMALLVSIWALTGMGAFWPVWPALGWGLAVAMHASSVRGAPRPAGP